MVANSLRLGFLVLVLFVIEIAHADSQALSSGDQEIVNYLHRQVMVKTSELGERVAKCEAGRASATVPLIGNDRLKQMGVTRQQAINALAYLNARNNALCEQGSREALVYALGMLRALVGDDRINVEMMEGIEDYVLYPSESEIESAIMFSKLEERVRLHFVRAVGKDPFDLMAALKPNKLWVDWRFSEK